MNNNKGSISAGLLFLLVALAFALGALVALFARPAQVSIGGAAGPEHTEQQFFKDGVRISSSTSATVLRTYNCNTGNYTLVALAGRGAATTSASVASTSLTLSGAEVGDAILVSFATSSAPQVVVSGHVQSANTAVVFFQNLHAEALAARTSSATVEACYLE